MDCVPLKTFGLERYEVKGVLQLEKIRKVCDWTSRRV